MFTAVTETLLDAKTSISFMVIAITDIKKGIEARYTFYLEDYRMASVEGLPYDEFSKRVLQESKGSTDYIGDEIGQHLEYSDIRMPDFLTAVSKQKSSLIPWYKGAYKSIEESGESGRCLGGF